MKICQRDRSHLTFLFEDKLLVNDLRFNLLCLRKKKNQIFQSLKEKNFLRE